MFIVYLFRFLFCLKILSFRFVHVKVTQKYKENSFNSRLGVPQHDSKDQNEFKAYFLLGFVDD